MENFVKNLILIYFFILFFTILTFFYNLNSQKKIKKNDIQNVINSKCFPIKKNYKHQYYEINNESYPKSLLLHRNKSINFECLNKNKKIKTILFWTKYYGMKAVNY